ncbi:terminal uridylyltransferase 4 [Poeciliopsis prolifica]|uniref:terminal uridylyltransferase 4 n=1 Tax=Poeciliopsis prolifica TaxID=188132 RepID=UPI002412FCC8|nr:terminal uridylyltransferase 4 [Poeciliopsis prolifica]XP_054895395.1 terminal uridylyltransferase 4 [Poeciliopsis prolifica]
MENSSKPYRSKQKNREKGTTASDKGENWKMQDQIRGHSSRSEEGQHGKKSQGGPYNASPKKGGLGPLGYSPGGFRGGQSPSQRDDLRWSSVNNDFSQEEIWRGQSQQHDWRRRNEGESSNECGMREYTDDIAHKPGRRRRNRNKKKGFAEESKGLEMEEARVSVQDLQNARQAEKRLKREEIYLLRKNSHGNPGAVYTCALCDIPLESISHAFKHVRDKRHKKRAREKQEQLMLTEIMPPGPEHISAVTAALKAVVQEHGMNDEDVLKRESVVSVMQDVLLSVLPEIRLRLYGSSCTKFGFKDSDVNIDVQYPPHMHQPDVLLVVKEAVSVSPFFLNVEADFHARVPVVICKERKSGFICKVSAGNENAFQTTSYLSALANMEHLLLPLVLGLRHWAQICEIDRPEEGGLPPYVFALMVIFFLQKRKEPLLPTYLNQIKVFSMSRLSAFNLTHTDEVYIHWTYNVPSSKESSQPAESSTMKGKVPLVFQSPRLPVEVGLLWIEMLRFYSLEFSMADNVISVRTNTVLSREMKDWPKKRIAIEDPFAVKRNVARSVNSQQMFDYILHCLKTTYKYFALPLSTSVANHKDEAKQGLKEGAGGLSVFSQLSLDSPSQTQGADDGPDDSDCIIEEEEEVEECSDSDEEQEKEKADLGKSSFSEDEEDEEDQDEDLDVDNQPHDRQHLDSFTTEDEDIFSVDEISGEELLSDEEPQDLDTPGSLDEEEEEELAHVRLSPSVSKAKNESTKNQNQQQSQCAYEFTKQAFTKGKSHMVVCSLCKRDGHLKKDCPEDFKKVELDPLPPLTPDFLSVLNRVCEQCYTDFAPDDLENGVRELILQDLESFVRRQFAGARLQLFGSSKNGFGFRQSDLDICMVLEGKESMDDVDCINIIKGLARQLKKHPGLRNILPITTAKVPIVKFYHLRTGLEGDISLYNTLALHNTRLLASYAAIDRRVKILCYIMKVFAKMCDIGDASRGSLSSYAYTLMVLFFLQQRNPPVIPVLQEIYGGKTKPEVLVDGWNVYFFDDLKTLPCHWPLYGQNTESVGELWLGLLRFYTEDFDFREHVVCIRQHTRLTTFNKQWTSKYIVIEDPFDLNHNLGAGLSRRMTNFIMKAFINGRRVFGTPMKGLPPEYPSEMEYFFDPEVLTEGEVAPNDRCCRVCGKIGHFLKDCPMRNKPKHRRESENRLEHFHDSTEEFMDPIRYRNEHWKKRDALDMRCCFLCGSSTHIKKDCHLYRSPAGNVKMENVMSSSSSHLKNMREKEKQGLAAQEERRRKHQNVILSPQAGSLARRNLGRSGPRKNPEE